SALKVFLYGTIGDKLLYEKQQLETHKGSTTDHQELERIEDRLTEINRILGTRKSRLEEQGSTDPRLEKPFSLTAAFVGDEGGSRQLLLELIEQPKYFDQYSYFVSDLSSSKASSGMGPHKSTRFEAIRVAVETYLSEPNRYGRGYCTIEVPPPQGAASTAISLKSTFRVKSNEAGIVLDSVENITSVLTIALVAAAPFTGGASLALLLPVGIVGAIPSAYRLYDRAQADTFYLDYGTALDIVNVLSSFSGVGGKFAGKLKWVPMQKGFMIMGLGMDGLGFVVGGAQTLDEIQRIAKDETLSQGARRAMISMAIGRQFRDIGIMAGSHLLETGQSMYDSEQTRATQPQAESAEPVKPNTRALPAPTEAPSSPTPIPESHPVGSPAEQSIPKSTPSTPETTGQNPVAEKVPTQAESPEKQASQSDVPAQPEEVTPSEPDTISEAKTLHDEIVDQVAKQPSQSSTNPEIAALSSQLDQIIANFERMNAAWAGNETMQRSLEYYIEQAAESKRKINSNPNDADVIANARDLIQDLNETRRQLRPRTEPERKTAPERSTETKVTEGPQTPVDLIQEGQFTGYGNDTDRLRTAYEAYRNKQIKKNKPVLSPEDWARRQITGEPRRILDKLLPEGWARRSGSQPKKAERGVVHVEITEKMLQDVPYPVEEVSIPLPIDPEDIIPLKASSDRPPTSDLRKWFLERLSETNNEAIAQFIEAQKTTAERLTETELAERGLLVDLGNGRIEIWPVDEIGNVYEVHHIQELRWGGSANAPENLIAIPVREHKLISSWWNKLASYVLSDPEYKQVFKGADEEAYRTPEILE
ncbi:MAG: hypothetical protein KDD14_20110, partial [Saprospiraceae bacterium]|nr:hypothetical protein [Saprospiraceae bacterium]